MSSLNDQGECEILENEMDNRGALMKIQWSVSIFHQDLACRSIFWIQTPHDWDPDRTWQSLLTTDGGVVDMRPFSLLTGFHVTWRCCIWCHQPNQYHLTKTTSQYNFSPTISSKWFPCGYCYSVQFDWSSITNGSTLISHIILHTRNETDVNAEIGKLPTEKSKIVKKIQNVV